MPIRHEGSNRYMNLVHWGLVVMDNEYIWTTNQEKADEGLVNDPRITIRYPSLICYR